uniref:PI-PLC Y-box domain-containing protein n=1 Tax=viral metagenome TaxID=1070528 RepID=A0A6C0D8M6_9ZZZZ
MASIIAAAQAQAQSALLQRTVGPAFASQANRFMPASTTNALYRYLTTGGTRMKKFFFEDIPSLTKSPFTPFKIMIWSFIILGLVGLAIYLKSIIKSSNEGFEDKNYQKLNRFVDTLKADDEGTPNINDKLINLQPLAFKQVSYLGPEYNKFDIIEGVNNQLQLGSRALILQIDFVDRNREGFCKKFEPCLYYKNEAGTVTSKNSAKLSEVFKQIGDTAFQPAIKNNQTPLLLFLHFVNLPNPSEPNEYLGKVANALQVLKPYLLTGGFYRSEKEDDLFNLKFNEFAGKIIVGTNVRTSSLVKSDKNDDLDYMVNFHYYVPDKIKVDSTVSAPYGAKINALVFDYESIKKMSPQDFTQKYSSFFTILKPPQTHNISKEEMNMFLKDYGVNVIPYEYFKDSYQNNMLETKVVRKLYKSAFSTRIPSLKY